MTGTRAPLVLLAGAFLLAACVHHSPAPLSAADGVNELRSRSLDDPAFLAFMQMNVPKAEKAAPVAAWDLEMLTWAALYFSPELDAARAERAIADAAVQTASALPNPFFSLGNSYVTPEDEQSPWILQPTLDFTVETAGKRTHRSDQARALATAARFELGAVAWDIRSRLRNALVEVILGEQELALLRAEEAIREELLDTIEQRVALGDLSSLLVADAAMELGRLRQMRLESEDNFINARISLAETIGVPVAALSEKTFLLPEVAVPSEGAALPEHLEADALLTRLDVLGSLAEYAASEAALQLEIARQYPDVVLGPGYRWREIEKRWLVGIAFELPIFGRNEGPIAEALANRALAAARFQQVQNAALANLDRAIRRYSFTRDVHAQATKSLAAQEIDEQKMEQAFALGDIDAGTFANIRLQTAAARREQMRVFRDLQLVSGALEDAVQKPWDPTTTLPLLLENLLGTDRTSP